MRLIGITVHPNTSGIITIFVIAATGLTNGRAANWTTLGNQCRNRPPYTSHLSDGLVHETNRDVTENPYSITEAY